MIKKPDWYKRSAKHVNAASEHIGDAFNASCNTITEGAKSVDDSTGVFTVTKKLAHKVGGSISTGVQTSTKAIANSEAAKHYDALSTTLNNQLLTPANNFTKSIGVNHALVETGHAVSHGYGAVRESLTPYFAPSSAHELLENTRAELIYLNACILQISQGDAEKIAGEFSKTVLSKVAGIGFAGGLFSMVSTFGTAGTGTAIASLSGAAASNATLAWVGSLLGGGMTTGAALTGGLSIIAGVITYKMLGSEARDINSLSKPEQQILEQSGLLIAAIDSLFERHENNVSQLFLPKHEAQSILEQFLIPLQVLINENKTHMLAQLDNKHYVLFKEHALRDFNNVVIAGFNYFIANLADQQNSDHIIIPKHHYSPCPNQAPEFVIGGMIYALMNNMVIDASIENTLAISALKRMKNDWQDLSNNELGQALRNYDDEALKGVANNAKGIYHELLFVDTFNANNTELTASVFEKTNYPGADIQIINASGDVVREAQMKALQSEYGITHHFERYPDIEVIATSEVAALFDHVESSGVSNAEISASMQQTINALSENTALQSAQGSAELASVIAIFKASCDMAQGETLNAASKRAAAQVSAATGSTLITAWLFC